MASKKFKGVTCVYCVGKPASTIDHVFARQFFLEEHRANLPKVPACNVCNGRKSALEHYLTTILPFGGRHRHAERTLAEMVPKRLEKNLKLHRSLGRAMKRMWVNYNGVNIQVSAVPVDSERVLKLFDYIVRGLMWVHWRQYLTATDLVRVCASSPALERRFNAMSMLKGVRGVAEEVGAGTVRYEGYQFLDTPTATVWRLSLYGGLTFTDPARGETSSSSIGALTGPRLSNDVEPAARRD
jgi:hypothetical protein